MCSSVKDIDRFLKRADTPTDIDREILYFNKKFFIALDRNSEEFNRNSDKQDYYSDKFINYSEKLISNFRKVK